MKLWTIARFVFFCILPIYVYTSSDQFPCGVVPKRLITKGEFFNRIRGGWEARPHSLPWQIRLFIKADDGRVATCGGTLVESGIQNGTDLIVTAAHCITTDGGRRKFVGPDSVRVVVGAHDFDKKDEPSRRVVNVSSVVGHNWYDDEMIIDDIAIIKLAEVVPYTDTTRPACLPKPKQELPYGVTCVSSGWGLIDHGELHTSPRLNMRTAQIDRHENCRFKDDPDKVLCTKGHGDHCNGDSGGPLVCPINDQYTLFGVVSYGTLECTDSMFASVPRYMRWLRRNNEKASRQVAEEEPMEID